MFQDADSTRLGDKATLASQSSILDESSTNAASDSQDTTPEENPGGSRRRRKPLNKPTLRERKKAKKQAARLSEEPPSTDHATNNETQPSTTADHREASATHVTSHDNGTDRIEREKSLIPEVDKDVDRCGSEKQEHGTPAASESFQAVEPRSSNEGNTPPRVKPIVKSNGKPTLKEKKRMRKRAERAAQAGANAAN